MATADVIDFEKLLAEIPGDSPSGVELMDDDSPSSVFIQIRTALKSARDAEQRLRKKELMDRLAVGNEAIAAADPRFLDTVEPPDWQLVYDQATDALTNKSKDLWVAAWLIDALVRLHGFAGLRDGFRLIRELSEKYWDMLHPQPAERGLTRTFSQLSGLADGALTAPIAEIPITANTSAGLFRPVDYVDAVALEDVADVSQKAQQIERGTHTLETIREAVNETPPEFFVSLINDLEQALQEHQEMCQFLAERCGKDEAGVPIAPPVSHIRKSLEKAKGCLLDLAAEIIEQATATLSDEEAPEQGVGPGPTAATISSRQAAFQTLGELARFFRKTEPLSPISFELDKIVRWGKMEFPDLMKELIDPKANPQNALQDLFRQTGIKDSSVDDENPSSS